MRKLLPIIIAIFVVTSCLSRHENSQRVSTAAANVSIVDHEFIIPNLDRQRTVRLYLPPDYDTSQETYPVIYAHDGQNLFDDTTSYVGEWGLDESLNQIAEATGFKAIVVGIDNGQEKRMNELSPWTNQKFGPAEGEEYMRFIIEVVKPYIDSNYRSRQEREHTAIMGSSMGGLISHYAIYRFPDVFSKAIIFSPSYWYADEVWGYTKDNPLPHDARLWLEIGAKEGNAVSNTNKMYDVILATGHPQKAIHKQVDPEGEHNEVSWRHQFGPAVKWLFEISD